MMRKFKNILGFRKKTDEGKISLIEMGQVVKDLEGCTVNVRTMSFGIPLAVEPEEAMAIVYDAINCHTWWLRDMEHEPYAVVECEVYSGRKKEKCYLDILIGDDFEYNGRVFESPKFKVASLDFIPGVRKEPTIPLLMGAKVRYF
ncbi:MAG: hypothetical protein ABIB71_08540 [Candidatus Woesearchaeota archaeon]